MQTLFTLKWTTVLPTNCHVPFPLAQLGVPLRTVCQIPTCSLRLVIQRVVHSSDFWKYCAVGWKFTVSPAALESNGMAFGCASMFNPSSHAYRSVQRIKIRRAERWLILRQVYDGLLVLVMPCRPNQPRGKIQITSRIPSSAFCDNL